MSPRDCLKGSHVLSALKETAETQTSEMQLCVLHQSKEQHTCMFGVRVPYVKIADSNKLALRV